MTDKDKPVMGKAGGRARHVSGRAGARTPRQASELGVLEKEEKNWCCENECVCVCVHMWAGGADKKESGKWQDPGQIPLVAHGEPQWGS